MPAELRFAIAASALVVLATSSHAALPRVILDGYELELAAHEPDIVTPVALTFDNSGALLVIESHTHKRPDQYDGPTATAFAV